MPLFVSFEKKLKIYAKVGISKMFHINKIKGNVTQVLLTKSCIT
jgi:hypothetical protein